MSLRVRLGPCCALACLLASSPAFSQTIQFVPGSTVPRVQLTGEHFQIYSNGRYFTDFTPGRTLSTSGVLGTDLAFPITYADKIVFLFGDTVGVYPSGGKYVQGRPGPRGAGDSVGYIPNADLSQCRYIEDVDRQLALGVATPVVSPGTCPSLRFYHDPSRGPEGYVFKPILISNLAAEESQAPFHVPASGFKFNDRLYMFYITKIQESTQGGLAIQSILARSDQSPGSWSDANPPTFTRLATVSSHEKVADPDNPPDEAGQVGKFMFSMPVVMDAATIAAAGLTAGLPASLQSAPSVVFIFGTSYRGTQSNLFLAAFALADTEAGPSKWSYYKGNNLWSGSEQDAAPLLATGNVSSHSVVWNSALKRFVLIRASAGLVAQFSTTPWGPWSDPVTVFARNDPWRSKLMHQPGLDPLVQSLIPIFDRTGSQVVLPDTEIGVPYAPNLLDQFTLNPDGSVTVYYTLSLWNPYQVLLMSTTFVSVTPATMTLDKTSLQFAATSSGAAFVQQTQPQSVRLLQSGTATVTWTATPSQPWLTVSPSSGTGSATLTVRTQFASGLPVSGTRSATIALAFTGASNTAGPITVGLTTIPNGASAAPVGVIDTPIDGASGVTGSIAVTGWAIDDLEVTRVRILRDPVAGEGALPIAIGTAVFVDGARTDVAGANPNAPRNTQAGWGYLLLTNFLPNQGNGTFTLSAYADDVDGHSTLLGRRTIICTNSLATRPFGAIDTPAQGETTSGTSYNNFGWVLARGPVRADPPNGTVTVVIDGVFGATPTGWVSRPDLTALFPAGTYPGVTNALGVSSFDTTTLSNGVHTIAWVVTANNGQADGIGSRFFTVANGAALHVDPGRGVGRVNASTTLDALPMMAPARSGGARSLVDDVNRAPLDLQPITGRRGYDLAAPFQSLDVDANGRVTVDGEELDRFELRVGQADSATALTGYGRAGSSLSSLPIGSHLDPDTGVFTWQPGVGFVHDYDLVFVRWQHGVAIERREVRVVLHPKASHRVGPMMVIDTPSADAVVAQPFVVAGWAVDRDAVSGTGIDAVHVWAYPADGGDPVFVGAASPGGSRPDVATLLGDRFTDSGYGLTVASLAPGTYDLAVFAWSTAANRFLPATVVRVRVQ